MASVGAGKPLLHDFDSPELDNPPQNATVLSLDTLESGDHELDFVGLRRKGGFWERFWMAVRRRRDLAAEENETGRVRLPVAEDRAQWRRSRYRTNAAKIILGLLVAVIFFFGIVHIVNASLALVNLVQDDSDPFPQNWDPRKQYRPGVEPDLDGLTRDIVPIHCHSHNDYWRRIPLYDALSWGCTGVEADVWLFDGELFVGHNTNALTKDRTFRSMYVDPLVRILDHQNRVNKEFSTSSDTSKIGVFEVKPKQTLVLLVDFKNNGHDIYPVVSEQLAPFREKGYLSYFDGKDTVPGPITVVATGNAPFDCVTANTTYRDIFFDAPLDRMYQDPSTPSTTSEDVETRHLQPAIAKREGQGAVGTDEDSHFDITNSYYASVNFKKSIGWTWFGRLSSRQIDLIRGQVKGAHERGLKARYWGTPSWPIGLRNRVWDVLVSEGVDYLNGDDLRAMTKMDWAVKRHWGWIG